jgi:ribonuclease/clavin/mitogillin
LNIVNVGYGSTNYYVIGQTHNRLLIDVGWPRTLPRLQAIVKRMGFGWEDIHYLLVTHYHPDHAGLVQEVKNQCVRLVLLEEQAAGIPLLATYVKSTDGYVPIQSHDAIRLTAASSRAFLKSIGIAGEIVSTPGHSADSISLITDDGAAFTGDLEFPQRACEEALDTVTHSWRNILALSAKTIYPGHGPERPSVEVANALGQAG